MKNKCLMRLAAKQRIKLWDWAVRVKATYKVKDLSEKLLSILWVSLSVIKLLIIHVST